MSGREGGEPQADEVAPRPVRPGQAHADERRSSVNTTRRHKQRKGPAAAAARPLRRATVLTRRVGPMSIFPVLLEVQPEVLVRALRPQ